MVKCLQTPKKFQNGPDFHNFRANVRSFLWQLGYNLENYISDAKVFMTNWGNWRFVTLLVGCSLCGTAQLSCYMQFAASIHYPSAIGFKAFTNQLNESVQIACTGAIQVALVPIQWKSCYQASKTALTSLSLQCQRELGKLMNDGWALLLVVSQSFSRQSYGMLEEKACGSCPDAAC